MGAQAPQPSGSQDNGMVSSVHSIDDLVPRWLQGATVGADGASAGHSPTLLNRGRFSAALRAASLAWHPVWPTPIETVLSPAALAVVDPEMALPVVLQAWRATERELAGMTDDSPEQEYLQANASLLRAMYQRLYLDRMRS